MRSDWCAECHTKLQRVQLHSTALYQCPKCGMCSPAVRVSKPGYVRVARWIVNDWLRKVAL